MKDGRTTSALIRIVLFLCTMLTGLSLATAGMAMTPDWSGVASAPFDLVPHPSVSQPVMTAAQVTDIADPMFVADPFIFVNNGQWYLFMEVADSTGFGRISVATSPDGLHWTYGRVVLQESFHLSYPQVFSEGGIFYMMPETHEAASVRLYQATSFPYAWRLAATLVSGRDFVDPQIVRYNGTWYLFASDTSNTTTYLYYSDNLTSGWMEHPMSPVVQNDLGRARGGGRLLLYDGGRLIRTTQRDENIYGEAVRAFQVDVLTKTSYAEHEIPESPLLQAGTSTWNRAGMHHYDPWWNGSQWLVSVDGVSSDGIWSIGIYTPDTPSPPVIPKSGWTLKYVDSQETTGENAPAVNVFDNNNTTFWHTQWSAANPPCPHEIQIDLGASYSIGGFGYLPRQDGASNGMVGQWEFYVSSDGQSWGSPAAAGTWTAGTAEKEAFFASRTGRYIRFRALSEVNGKAWTSVAELTVYGRTP